MTIFDGAVTLRDEVNMNNASTVRYLAGSISNADVSSSADIAVTKLKHLIKVGTDFGVDWDVAPSADVEKIVYVASGTATIRLVKAVLRVTGTSSDVKFDLQKASAGSTTFATVLSGTINFTNSDTDNTAKTGSLSGASLVAGDVLRLDMDYTSATGTSGPFAWIEIDEGAN